MFCPRCSQEQASSEQRFCSRCGFPLADISEALANEGYVDRNIAERLKGLRRSVIIGTGVMALSLVFFVLSLALGTPEPIYVILKLLVMILVFLLGLSWIGYSLWQDTGTEDRLRQKVKLTNVDHLTDAKTSQLEERASQTLPESYAAPPGARRARDLAGSVTDSTTKLLDPDR